jgi:hypothetical protein
MWGKIMAKLNSPLAKFIGIVIAVLFITVFSSWTTQKNIQDTMGDYAKYQFAQSVETVLKQPDGVMDQLAEIKTIATDAKNGVETSNAQMYQGWVIDINKYYTQITTNHYESITKDHLTKVSNYWSNMPDKYKTPEVIEHEKYVVEWIVRHCK